MESLTVEYLIILKSKGSFCNNIKTFNSLIKAHDEIKIKGSVLTYNNLNTKYEVVMGEIVDKDQRYFNVKLTCNDVEKIEVFLELLKAFRGIIFKTEANVNTLWNDIGFYYCKLAYPLIFELENLMRKLITQFMLMTVGVEWAEETLPTDGIKESIKKKKREKNGYSDILHETDFIHLADFLFKQYHNNDINGLYKELRSLTQENIDIQKLKNYIPKSNWEKYFSNVVSCEDDHLKKQWSRLYDLRCLVAHNNFITKAEYQEIFNLYTEIKGIVENAVKNLNKIDIPEEDKEEIAESLTSNFGKEHFSFLVWWKKIEDLIMALAISKGYLEKTNNQTLSFAMKYMMIIGLISRELSQSIVNLYTLRSALLHQQMHDIETDEIMRGISLAKVVYISLKGKVENL